MSLRDALLSAGLVDEKKKKAAEREADARDRSRNQEKRTTPKRSAAPERVTPRTEEERAAAAAAVAEVIAAHGKIPRRGSRRWYYALRDGAVGWFELDGLTAGDLENGRTAIVEHEGEAVLVDAAAARGLLAFDGHAVRALKP